MATFEFANEWRPTNSIDIPELGNFFLEAINEEETYYYYLSVRSSLGTSTIVWYGPVVPDVERLPAGYQIEFERFPFGDKKMIAWITKWLNDKVKKITGAYLIDQNKFKENYRDVMKYVTEYNDEVY